MGVIKQPFGRLDDGRCVQRWTLTGGRLRVSLLTFGAAVQAIVYDGVDIVLGFDRIEDYLSARCPYIGTVVGRYANRLSDPLTAAGRTYSLDCNEGKTVQLHGGTQGLHRRLWEACLAPGNDPGVIFTLICEDMEAGCPGRMRIQVTYTLVGGAALRIEYKAVCDQDTVINLTNHAFFNLNGAGSEDIRNHTLELWAQSYLPVDERLLPLGEPCPVKGTPFAFTPAGNDWRKTESKIGDRLHAQHPQIALAGGIDHNFCIDGEGMRRAARLASPKTDIVMECHSDQPGLQIYLGQGLEEEAGKNGLPIGPYAGLCLETQHYPDSPSHPDYPTTFLSAGEVFQSTTEYRFICKEEMKS